jgi:hypothetical protein
MMKGQKGVVDGGDPFSRYYVGRSCVGCDGASNGTRGFIYLMFIVGEFTG